MFSKTKYALAAALIVGSASLAVAEDATPDSVRNYGPLITKVEKQIVTRAPARMAQSQAFEQWLFWRVSMPYT
jgi:hypothetical protein